MQRCTRCGFVARDLAEAEQHFSPDTRNNNGYQSHCRECRRMYARQRYQQNRATMLARQREYRRERAAREGQRVRSEVERAQASEAVKRHHLRRVMSRHGLTSERD